MRKQKALYLETVKLPSSKTVEKYKLYRNKKLVRYSKSHYYLTKCIEFKRNVKKLWNLINRTISKCNNKTDLIDRIRVGNVYRTDAITITSEFCNHFSTVGKHIADKISKSTKKIEDDTHNIEIKNQSLFLKPTTEAEINSFICALPNKMSSGYDNLNNTETNKRECTQTNYYLCKQIPN